MKMREEKQHNKRLVWIPRRKSIYSRGTLRRVLTWPPSVLQSPSSGLFSPPCERWFHSSVWSWHLNSAEETSCLRRRRVFQHPSAEAECCLISVCTAEEMLLAVLLYGCSSPPTLGVMVAGEGVCVAGGGHSLTCVLWRSCWLMARRSSSCCRSSTRASCFSQMSFSSIFMDISISCFIPICTSSSFSTSCRG